MRILEAGEKKRRIEIYKRKALKPSPTLLTS